MLASQYLLKDYIFRLETITKALKDQELDKDKSKLYTLFFDMILACKESYITLGEFEFEEYIVDIKDLLRKTKEAEKADILKENINIFINKFKERNFSDYTISDFTSISREYLMQYKPIDRNNLRMISQCIKKDRQITIFDPKCKDGKNLRAIKDHIDSKCYGLEQNDYMALKAKKELDKVVMGSFLGSRISNDAFDVMFIEPPISFATSELGILSKQEKNFIQNSLKYLRSEGVGIITLPYFKVTKEIALMLAKNFKDIQIRKLTGPDFYYRGYITIIGVKTKSLDPDAEEFKKLRSLYDIDSIKDLLSDPLVSIKLPQAHIDIDVFRGSILDVEEMDYIVKSSGCMDSFWKQQKVVKISESTNSPVLPFNIGQIGLVLTSGCLDGIIDEGNGFNHVIKGKVSKISSVERDNIDNNSIEVQETISNRVEINVFLANGEFKVLT